MAVREPPTPDQRSELSRSFERMRSECSAVLDSLRVMYGVDEAGVIRGQEICNDVQRLRWALDRGDGDSSSSKVNSAEDQSGKPDSTPLSRPSSTETVRPCNH